MQTRRLMRLMRLMIEFGSREFRSPEEIYGMLGISRTQFYRDKDELELMGFAFKYRRKRRAFTVNEDPGVRVDGLTLSEVLSLILAVGRLPETGDFGLTYRALAGLRKISLDRPGPAADFARQAVETVTRDVCGCDSELLERLVAAVNDRRRVQLDYGRPNGNRVQRISLDVEKLLFHKGQLILEGCPIKGRSMNRRFRVEYIRELAETPFLSPEICG